MGDTDQLQIDPSIKSSESSEPTPQPTSTQSKTADKPHRITIALGLLSPLLALISLGVSFYVFRDSQQSMRVAQRGYLGFHFESAYVGLENVEQATGHKAFRAEASVSVKDIGNTPAYIDSVKKELYAIEADDVWDHIGGSNEVSPNFDALSPRGSSTSQLRRQIHGSGFYGGSKLGVSN